MKTFSRVLIVSEANGSARIEHQVSAPDKKSFDRYVEQLKSAGYRVGFRNSSRKGASR